MMKKIKYSIALLFFIVLLGLLVDAGSDLLLYARGYYRSVSEKDNFIQNLPKNLDRQKYAKYYDDTRALETYYLPYIGGVIRPGEYGIYKIDEFGRREYSYHASRKQTKSILVLGASQSFGFYNSSDTTLVYYLAELLPEYRIDNYSSPGQEVSQNLANWQRIHNTKDHHYDLAIIVNGPVDYIVEYAKFKNVKVKERDNEIALVSFLRLVKNKIKNIVLKSGYDISLRDMEYYETAIPKKIMSGFEDIIDYGADLNVKTLIFIPPSVWGNEDSMDNIRKNITENEFMNTIARNLSNLSRKNSHVIDMSNIFDDKKELFFIDAGSHLTPNGNKILAQKIARYIKSNDKAFNK
ncbi:SGNH/GDSL hydrolase family protein [Vibrio gazogenes]|uniref:SGNH/GDSL hydrolase family protein n=1 Tax=Vibrio gazogenes TaxID=687 RepID=A0A1Z2SHG6_VIBGA|nr:SGNH/GDSL hydrolase family protein [Vibrio gazogenes]ASA56527.1 hypothetical protein BSQ33_13055 [Vibrio gazogenes]